MTMAGGAHGFSIIVSRNKRDLKVLEFELRSWTSSALACRRELSPTTDPYLVWRSSASGPSSFRVLQRCSAAAPDENAANFVKLQLTPSTTNRPHCKPHKLAANRAPTPTAPPFLFQDWNFHVDVHLSRAFACSVFRIPAVAAMQPAPRTRRTPQNTQHTYAAAAVSPIAALLG